jgi:hypothetical protein
VLFVNAFRQATSPPVSIASITKILNARGVFGLNRMFHKDKGRILQQPITSIRLPYWVAAKLTNTSLILVAMYKKSWSFAWE